jgi:hypothetical protein
MDAAYVSAFAAPGGSVIGAAACHQDATDQSGAIKT